MSRNAKPKTTSIVRRINKSIQLRKIVIYLFMDLLFWTIGCIGSCLTIEMEHGVCGLTEKRTFSVGKGASDLEAIKSIAYSFTSDGKNYTVPLGQIIVNAGLVIAAVIAVQMIVWLISWYTQSRKLKEYMRPLDEIAMKAELLSSQEVVYDKMHNLEEAIDHITEADNYISVGDSELMGLEDAINNLLKRLRASYQEQVRFVDYASHELRTPIAVIQGYASMLNRWGVEEHDALEEGIHAIREESEHMKELVDQLLFLARGDGGRQKLNFEVIQTESLMEEICEESEMIDSSHRYILQTDGDYSIKADRAMLKQAIRILIDNAAKYTPAGGRITIKLKKDEEEMTSFSVQDEGIGIEREEAVYMFERFFRGDAVRGSIKGSGLGLSIAKWIIDNHNGVIEALSFKDIGTRVTIRIPMGIANTID